MTRTLGADNARFFGNAHEAHYPNNPARSERMDTWNNHVGRAMAEDPRYRNRSAHEVTMLAIKNGCLKVEKK